MTSFTLKPGTLSLKQIHFLLEKNSSITLDPVCHQPIFDAHELAKKIANEKTVYGINTGFGLLANTKISAHELETLQERIILSHAAGVGDLLNDDIVQLILLLKINSLARGFSGVRLEIIEALINLYNKKIYPCIPAKGSVGASGDLAPLAHLSLVLLGLGHARYESKIISGKEALNLIGLSPFKLAPKEGLALLNGTQVSTALALINLLKTHQLFCAALITGALSIEAALGNTQAFDERIHLARGQHGQIIVAKKLRELLKDSFLLNEHAEKIKIQDPYCLRCQPQVMGACLDNLLHAAKILTEEANAVSDNPLVFVTEAEILSGGNFHAEPVAMAADLLAIVIAEIGSITERRIALLTDPQFSNGLPAFLTPEPGINSGFMLAQVTAAALVSENKTFAHPASVDSIPTSANQEDHVSMATFAARRLGEMNENLANIIAIEWLAACQGIDLRKTNRTAETLQKYYDLLRTQVSYSPQDRYFSVDINTARNLLLFEINSEQWFLF